MAARFDKFRIDTTRRDQNGYLEAKASVTRAGVFVYRHPNGTVTRELRHPDEVFRPDSLASLRNRPITFGHPSVGKLNSKNTRQYSVGSAVGEVQRNNMLVDTTLQITDEDTITRMETEDSPYREVSAGYETEIVRKDGVWNGEPYDHVQRNIVYNHIAIVPKGRAGHDVRVHLDAADAMMERYDTDEDDKTVTVIRRDRGDFDQDSFSARPIQGAAGVQGTFARFAREDDEEQEYVSRCMGDPEKLSEFPDEKQRSAVCYSKYREKGDAATEYAQQFTFAKSDGWTVDKATKWVQDYREPSPVDNRSNDMSKIKLRKDAVNTRTFKADAFQIDIDGTPEATEKAVDAMSVRYDAAIAHIIKIEGENHALQGKLDAHTDDGKVSVSLLTQLVQERTDACGAANYLGLKNFGTLETDAIKKLVVMKAFPKIDQAEITPEYIQGRYDAVIDRIKQEHKNLESLTNLTDVVTDPERFGAGLREDELSPRDKLLRDTSDMWDKAGRKQREQDRQRA